MALFDRSPLGSNFGRSWGYSGRRLVILAAPSLRSGHALSRGGRRATEPPSASPPIWVTVVAAGACGAANALSQPSAGCGRRSSRLTARAKPAGLHWDRNGLTNSWLADAEPTHIISLALCSAWPALLFGAGSVARSMMGSGEA